jgi:hypothetical protein
MCRKSIEQASRGYVYLVFLRTVPKTRAIHIWPRIIFLGLKTGQAIESKKANDDALKV